MTPNDQPRFTNRSTKPFGRRHLLLAGALIALSLPPRLVELDQPLLEKNAFRQTQTALTAKVFAESGIDLLDYETPLFGPPWKAPFELPLFQAGVALVSAALPEEVDFDVACRLTAVLSYYLSVVVLLLVCRHLLDATTCLFVLGVYLASPFNVIYSRASLIDYTSVAFALLFLLAALEWFRVEGRRRLLWTVVAVGAGSLAAMVKITTIPVVLPAVLLVAVWQLFGCGPDETDEGGPLRRALRRLDIATATQLMAMAVVPSLMILLWLRHTDQIKDASPLTGWLVSGNLDHWTWGRFGQRLEWASWKAIAKRLWLLMMPGALALFPAAALVRLRWLDVRARVLVVAMALGAALPVLLFFNLYLVHEYYLIAVAPAVAVLVGVGLAALTLRGSAGRRTLLLTLLVVACSALPTAYLREVRPVYDSPAERRRDLAVADMIARATEPGSPIVMTQPHSAWNPTIPYYAQRPVCILRNRAESPAIDRFLVEHGFRFAVLHRNNPLRLERWEKVPVAAAGEYDLYRLSYRGTDTEPPRRQAKPELLFSLDSAGALDSLVAAQQARITTVTEGIAVNALGPNPYLLLQGLDLPARHRLTLRAQLDAPAPTHLKVYFTTPDTPRYTEELHVRAWLRRGPNELRLEIPHPEVRGQLRLDPGTVAGRYLVRRLEVWTQPLADEPAAPAAATAEGTL